jgi:hypothetical protein
MPSRSLEIHELPVLLERDVFMRTLLRELSGTLQDVIGVEESAGFISVVGQRMGDQINTQYRAALEVSCLTRDRWRRCCWT